MCWFPPSLCYVMLGTNRKTSTNKWQVPFLVQTVLRIKYYAISITHFQPLGIRILQTCPFHVCQIFFSRRRMKWKWLVILFISLYTFEKPLILFQVIYMRCYRRLCHVCQRRFLSNLLCYSKIISFSVMWGGSLFTSVTATNSASIH